MRKTMSNIVALAVLMVILLFAVEVKPKLTVLEACHHLALSEG